MIMLMYFGCDSDTIQVVKYTPKRTFPVNIFSGAAGMMIKLLLTLQTSTTSIESPKLATGYHGSSRYESRTGNKLSIRYSQILNHELTVSWTLSICLLFNFDRKFARNYTLPITFLHLFRSDQRIRRIDPLPRPSVRHFKSILLVSWQHRWKEL